MFSLGGSPAGSGHATPTWGRASLPGGTVHSSGAHSKLNVGDPFNTGASQASEERGRATIMRLPAMFQGAGSGAATPLRSDGGTLPPSYGGTVPNSHAGTDPGGHPGTAVNSTGGFAAPAAAPPNALPDPGHELPPNGSGMMQHVLSVATMTLMPWAQFVAVAVAFMFQGGRRTSIAFAVLFMSCLVSLIAFFVGSGRAAKGPIYMYVAVLGLEATVSGVFFGNYMYGAYTFQYFSLSSRPAYANVPPTVSAVSREDGGMISFTAETQLDLSRALGHQDGKHVYCVVPILDDNMVTEANFWAVGKDCCSARSNFDCGDARDPLAKAGIVYQDSPSLFAPRDQATYFAAARQAASVYSLTVPERPVFVTWARDPEATEEALWARATTWLFVSAALYLVGSIVAGVVLHTFVPRAWALMANKLA